MEAGQIHWKSTILEIWTFQHSHWSSLADLWRMGVLQGSERDHSLERVLLAANYEQPNGKEALATQSQWDQSS